MLSLGFHEIAPAKVFTTRQASITVGVSGTCERGETSYTLCTRRKICATISASAIGPSTRTSTPWSVAERASI